MSTVPPSSQSSPRSLSAREKSSPRNTESTKRSPVNTINGAHAAGKAPTPSYVSATEEESAHSTSKRSRETGQSRQSTASGGDGSPNNRSRETYGRSKSTQQRTENPKESSQFHEKRERRGKPASEEGSPKKSDARGKAAATRAEGAQLSSSAKADDILFNLDDVEVLDSPDWSGDDEMDNTEFNRNFRLRRYAEIRAENKRKDAAGKHHHHRRSKTDGTRSQGSTTDAMSDDTSTAANTVRSSHANDDATTEAGTTVGASQPPPPPPPPHNNYHNNGNAMETGRRSADVPIPAPPKLPQPPAQPQPSSQQSSPRNRRSVNSPTSASSVPTNSEGVSVTSRLPEPPTTKVQMVPPLARKQHHRQQQQSSSVTIKSDDKSVAASETAPKLADTVTTAKPPPSRKSTSPSELSLEGRLYAPGPSASGAAAPVTTTAPATKAPNNAPPLLPLLQRPHEPPTHHAADTFSLSTVDDYSYTQELRRHQHKQGGNDGDGVATKHHHPSAFSIVANGNNGFRVKFYDREPYSELMKEGYSMNDEYNLSDIFDAQDSSRRTPLSVSDGTPGQPFFPAAPTAKGAAPKAEPRITVVAKGATYSPPSDMADRVAKDRAKSGQDLIFLPDGNSVSARTQSPAQSEFIQATIPPPTERSRLAHSRFHGRSDEQSTDNYSLLSASRPRAAAPPPLGKQHLHRSLGGVASPHARSSSSEPLAVTQLMALLDPDGGYAWDNTSFSPTPPRRKSPGDTKSLASRSAVGDEITFEFDLESSTRAKRRDGSSAIRAIIEGLGIEDTTSQGWDDQQSATQDDAGAYYSLFGDSPERVSRGADVSVGADVGGGGGGRRGEASSEEPSRGRRTRSPADDFGLTHTTWNTATTNELPDDARRNHRPERSIESPTAYSYETASRGDFPSPHGVRAWSQNSSPESGLPSPYQVSLEHDERTSPTANLGDDAEDSKSGEAEDRKSSEAGDRKSSEAGDRKSNNSAPANVLGGFLSGVDFPLFTPPPTGPAAEAAAAAASSVKGEAGEDSAAPDTMAASAPVVAVGTELIPVSEGSPKQVASPTQEPQVPPEIPASAIQRRGSEGEIAPATRGRGLARVTRPDGSVAFYSFNDAMGKPLLEASSNGAGTPYDSPQTSKTSRFLPRNALVSPDLEMENYDDMAFINGHPRGQVFAPFKALAKVDGRSGGRKGSTAEFDLNFGLKSPEGYQGRQGQSRVPKKAHHVMGVSPPARGISRASDNATPGGGPDVGDRCDSALWRDHPGLRSAPDSEALALLSPSLPPSTQFRAGSPQHQDYAFSYFGRPDSAMGSPDLNEGSRTDYNYGVATKEANERWNAGNAKRNSKDTAQKTPVERRPPSALSAPKMIPSRTRGGRQQARSVSPAFSELEGFSNAPAAPLPQDTRPPPPVLKKPAKVLPLSLQPARPATLEAEEVVIPPPMQQSLLRHNREGDDHDIQDNQHMLYSPINQTQSRHSEKESLATPRSVAETVADAASTGTAHGAGVSAHADKTSSPDSRSTKTGNSSQRASQEPRGQATPPAEAAKSKPESPPVPPHEPKPQPSQQPQPSEPQKQAHPQEKQPQQSPPPQLPQPQQPTPPPPQQHQQQLQPEQPQPLSAPMFPRKNADGRGFQVNEVKYTDKTWEKLKSERPTSTASYDFPNLSPSIPAALPGFKAGNASLPQAPLNVAALSRSGALSHTNEPDRRASAAGDPKPASVPVANEQATPEPHSAPVSATHKAQHLRQYTGLSESLVESLSQSVPAQKPEAVRMSASEHVGAVGKPKRQPPAVTH